MRRAARLARRAGAALAGEARARLAGLMPADAAVARTLDVVRTQAGAVTPGTIEVAATLTQSLRGAADPDGGNRWLHHRWLGLFEEMMDGLGDDAPAAPYHALCLGAGTASPLAFPLLLFLGGAARVWVVEPALAEASEEWRRRWGLQELALRVLVDDVRSRHFRRAPSEMAAFADLRALFFAPTLDGALQPDAVRVVPTYVEDARIPDGTVDLVTSRSVLEHVPEPERCFDALAAMTAPGGVMFHWIDLSAHDDRDPFAFYFEPPAGGAGRRSDGLNGLRLSDYLTAFTARGFSCRVVDRTMVRDYELNRRRLLPRYAHYGEDDLRCRRAVLVVRAKGGAR